MTERTTIRLSDLKSGEQVDFKVEPDAEARAAVARSLEIDAVKKLRFEGRLVPRGRRDWTLEARLGATVVQPCVVTLAPVTTRIDEDVRRLYLADYTEPAEGGEHEMPEDETVEALPAAIDLSGVMTEALALALPVYPRAEGAEIGDAQYTEPGKTPLSDDDAKPFAALKALRDGLDDES